MILADLTTRVNFLTGTTPTEYTAAARLVSLNIWNNKVRSWIVNNIAGWQYDDSNYGDFPILTTDLVASQQDYGGLTPEGLLNIKRVEITYDGSTYNRALPFDINEDYNATDTTSIASNYSQSEPRYRFVQNSIFLYPIPDANVTDGLKVFIDRTAKDFTASDVTAGTATFGFDVDFHDIIALGMSYDWKSTKNNDKSLMQDIVLMKNDLLTHYSRKNRDAKYAVTPLIDDYS